jgi:hypothetical protein
VNWRDAAGPLHPADHPSTTPNAWGSASGLAVHPHGVGRGWPAREADAEVELRSERFSVAAARGRGGMVDLDAPLGQQFLDIAVGEAEPQVPADRQDDDLGREAEAGEGRPSARNGIRTASAHAGSLPARTYSSQMQQRPTRCHGASRRTTSSIQSPSASIEWTTVNSVRQVGWCPAGPRAQQARQWPAGSQPLSQRGGQQQPGVADRVVVVGDGEPAWAVGGWHRETGRTTGEGRGMTAMRMRPSFGRSCKLNWASRPGYVGWEAALARGCGEPTSAGPLW